jgi:hypothetical protein
MHVKGKTAPGIRAFYGNRVIWIGAVRIVYGVRTESAKVRAIFGRQRRNGLLRGNRGNSEPWRIGIYPGRPYACGKQETVGLFGSFGAAQIFQGTAFTAFAVSQGFHILEKMQV